MHIYASATNRQKNLRTTQTDLLMISVLVLMVSVQTWLAISTVMAEC